MKILLLGAGNSQLNAIRRLKQLGHTVIVTDYFANPPGRAVADYHERVSTFDVAANLEVADRYQVDAVMTLGTDQPVYTAARIAEALQLPTSLDGATARAVTNKRIMKRLFSEGGLPTVNYRLIAAGFADRELAGLRSPYVVKPVDSQGQRGVYQVQSVAEIRRVLAEVRSYSREDQILVEEYYPGAEITVSGWVVADETYLLSVVDRVAYPDPLHIGVCIRHHFPSRHLATRAEEIAGLTRAIVRHFGIHNGPIYFQMLLGAAGIKINEIACRLGGAYEDEYLKQATGIDLLGMLIDSACGRPVDRTGLQAYNFRQIRQYVSVELFFARPGTVAGLNDMEALRRLPGVVQAQHHLQPGDICRTMENATARAGYVIVAANNEADLARNLARVYEQLAVWDDQGRNLVLRFNE